MRTIRQELAETMVLLGGAAELSDGNEKAVEKALQRVRIARRNLADVEARLNLILHTARDADTDSQENR